MDTIALWIMAALYIFAGVMHMLRPKIFLRIIPPYIPFPKLANAVAGVAEMTLGCLLLLPSTRPLAAWGVIALLVAVFPANWHMAKLGGAAFNMPQWLLLARLPLQLVLIAWAYHYTH